jgi:hypothetical protein
MKKYLIYSSLLVLFLINNIAFGNTSTGSVGNKALTHVSNPLFSAACMARISKLNSETDNDMYYIYPLYVSEVNSGLIYFTEPKNGNSDLRQYYFSKYDSAFGSWEKPVNIEKEYSAFLEANKTMNFHEIFVTIDNDIYRIDFQNKTYSPQKLNINTTYIETSPMLSADGGTLYFVSDRPGGFGGKDIWASERLPNNNWSEPYNLGKEINTAEDEESPFLMMDDATLYFSSKGHNSMGGYDIFVSTRKDDGLWSAPENLGPDVNSASDDFYYVTDSYGRKAFYSSGKMQTGKLEVFSVKYDLDDK